jgi:uncharacterized membrane protein
MKWTIPVKHSNNNRSHKINQVVLLTIQMLGWVSFGLLLILLMDLVWPLMGLRPYLRPACHQSPTRCLMFDGHPLALCARCLGVYMGFLSWPFVRKLNWFFLLPWIFITAGDLIYQLLGGDGSNAWRLAAGIGLAYGIITGLLSAAMLMNRFPSAKAGCCSQNLISVLWRRNVKKY